MVRKGVEEERERVERSVRGGVGYRTVKRGG
jgi:hypothetical protein